MDKSSKVFLLHIQDAIVQIEVYCMGFSYEQFGADRKTQDAVIRQLEIIGEATSNLEDTFRNTTDHIPWREISDFRNVLAHEYWDVDLEIVWKTVQNDLPPLKAAILEILNGGKI